MNLATKAYLLVHIARWRLRWGKYDTACPPPAPDNPKFKSPRDAAELIQDGDVIALSGLGGNQWASVVYWAIRERFEATGHPRGLTVMCVGGMGSRGRVPGSAEEFGRPGLCTRFITGHVETFKSILRLADAGQLELQCVPQGAMALLFESQGSGEDSLVTDVYDGTFVDPRVGAGTVIAGADAQQMVSVEDGKLRFSIPKIDVAIFNVPAADREGNLYAKNCAMIAESAEIARAARKNNGKVIVNVGLVVDKGHDDVFMPAEDVDAVVVYPDTEQVGSVLHRRYWSMFTTDSGLPAEEAVMRVKFINHVLGITPRRHEVDYALARLGASVFAENARKGSLVNIGVGLPEEVCRLIYKGGLHEEITLFTESGVIGGIPAPGVLFGAALCPEKMIASVEAFRMVYEKLDVSILGVLQADSEGNVNVSKRGEGPINYVGPGGFIDFSTSAKTVIFVTSWMANAKVRLDGDRLKIVRSGNPKFTDRVDEITFSGSRAVDRGQRVFYVTNVGVFQLTRRGMELIRVAPGIDIQKDIIEGCPMKVVLPESGEVPVVDRSITTGEGFKLSLKA